MKKQKLKNLLKIGILTCGISFSLINCADKNISEDVSQENLMEEFTEGLSISITTTSFLNADVKFNSLTNKYGIDSNKTLQHSTNTHSKTSTSNQSSIVVFRDIIKEITQGDYTSYTMLIESLDDDPNTFYNLTIEEENGNTGMFVPNIE